jgi:hypothetical protein
VKEALLDTSIEVNIISLEIAEALSLLIESLGILYSISFNSSSKRFLGVIRDLDIKVLDVIVIVYIFITKVVNSKYSIILRNSYLASIRTKITRDDEDNYFVKLSD